MIEYLADFGGLFALYMLWHFAVDFGAQTHAQGHGKSVRNAKGNGYLLAHCLTYTVLMVIPLYFFLPRWDLLVAAVILWGSHMIGDTYWPVYLWYRFIRRPPLPEGHAGWSMEAAGVRIRENPGDGVILMVVDQVYHLTFLLPMIWMVLHHA